MKGLELSKRYFEEYGRPMLENKFASYQRFIAAGLVGEGSECFGYDDELSRDHDFGPGFCLWIPKNLEEKIGDSLREAYNNLPKKYMGYERLETPEAVGRIGVITIESFYERYTGLTHAPEDLMQWFRIPESFLATAVNGEVFKDEYNVFTSIRKKLKEFYPTDVVMKKLASRLIYMAQSGQYNYSRCVKRGDIGAADLCCAEFIKATLSAVYLLNKEYMPFYKWAFRGTENFIFLRDCIRALKELSQLNDSGFESKQKQELIDRVCWQVADEIRNRGWSISRDDFLQGHGQELMKRITDSRLASMHIMRDS